MKMLLAALVLVSASLATETNKATVQTNSVAVALKNRRAVLEAQLKQVDGRIETLLAQDQAQMKAAALRTGKSGKPVNTATIGVLRNQSKQIKAALIELDIAEGKLDNYKATLPKRYSP